MKILVIDDHVLIREALRGVLKQLNDDLVLLDASSSSQATHLIVNHADIGLIMLDLNLPDRDGFELLADLRKQHPAIPVVVLSAQQDREAVLKALDFGALGFIPKSAKLEVMVSALKLVLAGGIYVPPEVLVGEELFPSTPTTSGHKRPNFCPSDLGLTDRQVDVLRLMMQGKNNKLICRMLNLAEPTVKNHVTAILKALKVSNRTEAVIAANQLGWEFPAQAQTRPKTVLTS